MSDDIEPFEQLAAMVTRLRTALSTALVALGEIEQSESIGDTKRRARDARLAVRDLLRRKPQQPD